jgi:L-amino acid N-acyltransferase YncA
MTFSFEWHDKLSAPVEKAYHRGLATLIGEDGAEYLSKIAKEYEQHGWFKIIVAKDKETVVGVLALYYEAIHGSHEIWYSVDPDHRRLGIGYQLTDELIKNGLKNGVKIVRADFTMEYTRSQKYFFKKGYKAVGLVPESFSFLENKPLGSAIMSWVILDPKIAKAYQDEKRESLDWKNQHYFLE